MDPALLDRLRSDLDDADFRAPAVATLLGDQAERARGRGVLVPARRVLAARAPSPLATLVGLFLLGERVDARDIDAALPALGFDGALELGIVEDEERSLDGSGPVGAAALSLTPVEVADACSAAPLQWWIVSDLDDALRRGPARRDHVMGVGGATRSLIAQAPPQRIGTALDLGTGCGIVALHLTRRAERVVATDLSERALRFARANARLNGAEDRIEFRSGDLFAPVEGERFDLVLSNPPFVITPRVDDESERYVYRDGGLAGDELAARVVRHGPRHLAEAGSLVCLANWEYAWGASGLARVEEWVVEAGERTGPLSAWVIERDRVDPVQYAETWARDGGTRPGDPAFDALLEAWLDDFAARRITGVGLGSIRIRREPASGGADPVVRAEHAPGAWSAEVPGSALDAAFRAGAATSRMSDAEILAELWRRDDTVVEEREHQPGAEAPSAIALLPERPLARRITADPLLSAAVGASDGELTLGQIADALATLLEVDREAAAEALVAGFRELAWLGVLAPPGNLTAD